MKVDDVVQILKNRLERLGVERSHAVQAGLLDQVVKLDGEIVELESTIVQIESVTSA
jgi:hypothetical protein